MSENDCTRRLLLQTLGISDRTTYLAWCRSNHPDKHPTGAGAANTFAVVKAAYEAVFGHEKTDVPAPSCPSTKPAAPPKPAAPAVPPKPAAPAAAPRPKQPVSPDSNNEDLLRKVRDALRHLTEGPPPPPDEKRCTAKTTSGDRCKQLRAKGYVFCRVHVATSGDETLREKYEEERATTKARLQVEKEERMRKRQADADERKRRVERALEAERAKRVRVADTAS